MKTRYFFGSVIALCLSTSGLMAWQRSAMNDCKIDKKSCTADSATCKAQLKECEQKAPDKDEASFVFALSSYANSLFQKFSAEQKKQAMDFADGNKMAPDDAVLKASGQCQCK